MHNTVHADLVAKDSVPHKSHINLSNRDEKSGAEVTALSGDDVLVSIADLWNQLVGLRRQVEWLGDLMDEKANGGPKALEMNCQVCGFQLKPGRM